MRWMKFNAVGITGLIVHFSLLGFLLHVVGMHYLLATALSLETAILQKFFWHCRWTWADRIPEHGRVSSLLLRFNLTSLILLGVNVLVTWVLTGFWKVDPLLANLLCLLPCSLASFFITNRFVFVQRRPSGV